VDPLATVESPLAFGRRLEGHRHPPYGRIEVWSQRGVKMLEENNVVGLLPALHRLTNN
jgi:hypothetical protein